MLGSLRQLGGNRAMYNVASGCGAYVGGTPAKMTTGATADAISGATPDDFLVGVASGATTTGRTAYLGIFANCKAYDQGIGYDHEWSSTGTGRTYSSVYKATVFQGPTRVRLQSGTKTISATVYTDGYPYVTGDSWDEGDLLYISTGGLWTRTPPSSGATARGVVEAVGSNYLDVYFW